MKRFLALFFLLAVTLGVATPDAAPPPAVVKPGVKVNGLSVAGLTSEPARMRIGNAFSRPLRFTADGKTWSKPASELGASGAIDAAVARALEAPRGTDISIQVSVTRAAVTRYVQQLDRKFSRAAEDAQLAGLGPSGAPAIEEAKPGRAVVRSAMIGTITRALRLGHRGPFRVPMRPVEAEVTKAEFGPVIVISRGSNTLRLYDGERLVRTFGVATGSSQYPTPAGTWSIVSMQRNPWWIPPDSEWARGQEPVPPGPSNPLGSRWMGLSAAGVGIHATPNASSIGYSVSHGCIRMHVSDAEWLFEQVDTGTPVVIV